MADPKYAAYVCTGCGIGERIDAAQTANIAQKEGKIALVRRHEFLCNADGVALIRSDIDKEGVTHVAIAACSRACSRSGRSAMPPPATTLPDLA